MEEEGVEDTHLGHMVVESARKELGDFYTKVLPVCEQLDNLGLLYVVSSTTIIVVGFTILYQ